MSIELYSAFSSVSIIECDSSTPLYTQFVGELPLPELAGVTTLKYLKGRFALPGERASSTVDFGTKDCQIGINYTPWGYATGSPNFQFPKIGMFSSAKLNMREEAYNLSAASMFLDAQQTVSDDDGGTFYSDARSNNLVTGAQVESDERWLAFFTTSELPSGKITIYVIDPEDGALLFTASDTDVQDGNASPFVGGTPIDGSRVFCRLYGTSANDTVINSDWDIKLGEFVIWHELKSLATMQAFAQIGFAAINEPSGLILDWNFMLDWRSGDDSTIADQSGNGNFGNILDASVRQQFSTDNPVPVFIPQQTGNEHDIATFNIFSGTAGALYMGVYARNAAAPTAAALVAGTGALTTATDTLDGINTKDVDIAQPDTGTDYTVYFVQDTTGSGDYSEVYEFDYTSPTKYSETVGTYQNEPLASITAIEYSWFDSVDFDNLGPAKETGNAEVTDASGLLEITLPTSINTAKGSQGVMSLKVVSGGKTRTGSHIATVK